MKRIVELIFHRDVSVTDHCEMTAAVRRNRPELSHHALVPASGGNLRRNVDANRYRPNFKCCCFDTRNSSRKIWSRSEHCWRRSFK